MAFVEVFCFYFSVRLGSILIGVFTLFQVLLWLILCLISSFNLEQVSDQIRELSHNDMLYATDILKAVETDPQLHILLAIAFFTIFAFSCAAMIFGVYQFKCFFVYPFLVIDFLYITSLLISYVIVMLILKKNEYGLGSLIFYSVLGEFIFLYLYYTWFCVFSYCQIVRKLEKKIKKLKMLEQQHENIGMYLKQY